MKGRGAERRRRQRMSERTRDRRAEEDAVEAVSENAAEVGRRHGMP